MKKLLAGLLALFVLTAALSLPSCIKIQKVDNVDTEPGPDAPETKAPEPGAPETDEPETEAPETEAPVIPVNFAYDDLLAQNQIPNLLSRYESVTITRTYDSGSTTESFWLRDGDRVLYDISVYDDGETAYSSEGGSDRGFDFTAPSGEPVTATKWATSAAGSSTRRSWANTAISS